VIQVVDRNIPVQSGGETTMQGEDTTVSIRLSEGEAQPQQVTPVPLADGEPLSDEEIQAILDRLPELEGEQGDQVDFRIAQDPIPPPLTGETVEVPFRPRNSPFSLSKFKRPLEVCAVPRARSHCPFVNIIQPAHSAGNAGPWKVPQCRWSQSFLTPGMAGHQDIQ
jgi:hypothetical protein